MRLPCSLRSLARSPPLPRLLTPVAPPPSSNPLLHRLGSSPLVPSHLSLHTLAVRQPKARLWRWVPRFSTMAAPPSSSAAASGGLVATHNEEQCIFCKIIAGNIPSVKLLETDSALAILDAFPMAKGHCLLLPKRHVAFLEDMSPEEAAAVLKELPRLSRAVRLATGVEGINIAQNNGSIAGQVVFHVHFHILPRTDGDGLVKLGKSGGKIEAGEAASLKDAITAFLPSAASL